MKALVATLSLLALSAACTTTEHVSQPRTAPSAAATHNSTSAAMPAAAPRKSTAAIDLHTAMRKLWEDHITYTRNYIISALAGLEDTDEVAQRLLRNQDDIGAAIKPYYGDEAGTKLSKLLRDHILIAADVVKAAKAGDKDQVAAEQKRWTDNGKDLAAFLSGANPNWSKAELERMLQKHLDLTTGEVVSRLEKNWKRDIQNYDEGHTHMLMFADMLSDGVIKQFPAKFAGS